MPIKNLPSAERPYEKMEMYGADKLSNSELLAIIIKTGTKEKTVLEIAKQVLSIENGNVENNNMSFLQELSVEELMQINGIGKIKAIQIKAVCELAKRMSKPLEIAKIQIKSNRDVANLLMDELRTEKREKVKELILNTKNILLKIVDISYGGTNSATLDVKSLLVEPIKMCAPKIILVHNHPSGDPTPSPDDINITKKIYNSAKIMGIELLDHIVIGDYRYTSAMTKDII